MRITYSTCGRRGDRGVWADHRLARHGGGRGRAAAGDPEAALHRTDL